MVLRLIKVMQRKLARTNQTKPKERSQTFEMLNRIMDKKISEK